MGRGRFIAAFCSPVRLSAQRGSRCPCVCVRARARAWLHARHTQSFDAPRLRSRSRAAAGFCAAAARGRDLQVPVMGADAAAPTQPPPAVSVARVISLDPRGWPAMPRATGAAGTRAGALALMAAVQRRSRRWSTTHTRYYCSWPGARRAGRPAMRMNARARHPLQRGPCRGEGWGVTKSQGGGKKGGEA